jgi:hypothetical protein
MRKLSEPMIEGVRQIARGEWYEVPAGVRRSLVARGLVDVVADVIVETTHNAIRGSHNTRSRLYVRSVTFTAAGTALAATL